MRPIATCYNQVLDSLALKLEELEKSEKTSLKLLEEKTELRALAEPAKEIAEHAKSDFLPNMSHEIHSKIESGKLAVEPVPFELLTTLNGVNRHCGQWSGRSGASIAVCVLACLYGLSNVRNGWLRNNHRIEKKLLNSSASDCRDDSECDDRRQGGLPGSGHDRLRLQADIQRFIGANLGALSCERLSASLGLTVAQLAILRLPVGAIFCTLSSL